MGGAPVVAPRERTVRFPPDAVSVVADKETMLLSDSTVSPLLPVTEDPNIWMPAGPLTDEPPVIDTVPPVRTDDAPECAMSTPIEPADSPAMVKLPAVLDSPAGWRSESGSKAAAVQGARSLRGHAGLPQVLRSPRHAASPLVRHPAGSCLARRLRSPGAGPGGAGGLGLSQRRGGR